MFIYEFLLYIYKIYILLQFLPFYFLYISIIVYEMKYKKYIKKYVLYYYLYIYK